MRRSRFTLWLLLCTHGACMMSIGISPESVGRAADLRNCPEHLTWTRGAQRGPTNGCSFTPGVRASAVVPQVVVIDAAELVRHPSVAGGTELVFALNLAEDGVAENQVYQPTVIQLQLAPLVALDRCALGQRTVLRLNEQNDGLNDVQVAPVPTYATLPQVTRKDDHFICGCPIEAPRAPALARGVRQLSGLAQQWLMSRADATWTNLIQVYDLAAQKIADSTPQIAAGHHSDSFESPPDRLETTRLNRPPNGSDYLGL